MKNSIFISTNLNPNSGGGNVSKYELEVLNKFTDVKLVLANNKFDIPPLKTESINPLDHYLPNNNFLWDYLAYEYIEEKILSDPINIVFINGSPFGRTVNMVQSYSETWGVEPLIISSQPAHNLEDSIDEHHRLGYEYEKMYPHMIDDFLFDMQTRHIYLSDIVICPSRYSVDALKKLNLLDDQEIKIIPHGVDVPKIVAPLPEEFRVGYMGSCLPDKGVSYAIAAWNELAYKDSVFGYAGPHENEFDEKTKLIQPQKGSMYKNLGWVENIDELYNNISVYIQPSVTEGFGLEVLEAMARGRPVICSDGAGASEIVEENSCGFVFEKRNIKELMKHIQYFKDNPSEIKKFGERARKVSDKYQWENIMKLYEEVIESGYNGRKWRKSHNNKV